MGGYDEYSKSNNARAAEAEGRYPLKRAAKEVARKAACTQSVARHVLKESGTSEWHHTSCRYNKTDYYHVEEVLEQIADDPEMITIAQGAVKQANANNRPGLMAEVEFPMISLTDEISLVLLKNGEMAVRENGTVRRAIDAELSAAKTLWMSNFPQSDGAAFDEARTG